MTRETAHYAKNLFSKLAPMWPAATSHAGILLRGIYPAGEQGFLQAPLEPQYEEGFPFGPFKADFCLAGGEQVILFSWGLDSQDYPIEWSKDLVLP